MSLVVLPLCPLLTHVLPQQQERLRHSGSDEHSTKPELCSVSQDERREAMLMSANYKRPDGHGHDVTGRGTLAWVATQVVTP